MKFSIITINKNNGGGLRKTIESIIKQTYKDWELIVIDGASTDDSVMVIKEYEKHITYWVSEIDSGIYNAMNKGVKRAQGELFAFINSGDCLYKTNILETISSYSQNFDILVGRDYHFNDITNKGFASIMPQWVSMLTFYIETLPHQSAFFKHTLFQNKLYDETFSICADMAFYIDVIVKQGYKVLITDQIICKREQGGISNRAENIVHEERLKIINSVIPIGVRKDYETLTLLDKSTVYKFFYLCNKSHLFRRILTIFIKIYYKINFICK